MKRLLQLCAALCGLAGLACIGLYFFKGGANGKLTWEDPVVRKSLMTFAYKVYGDPSVEEGRFFLSKIVFHNEGTGPVYDLSVSYQIPEYVSWTTPMTQSELPAGQTIIALYYPQLPSKVTELTTQTNATLETRIRWANSKGEAKEEILRAPVVMRGVNEVEYTDVPESELKTYQEDFYNYHALAEIESAMVTPNDPVVKEFVAEVTKRTGGTTAGITRDPSEQYKEGMEFMKALYDYMCDSGMRYTSNEGVPATNGDVHTLVQTVRMPRDVVITNQGLCVELAILWASVLEQIGLDPSLVFVPGHCYTIVPLGGKVVAIECTAITPKAVKGFLKDLGLSENATRVPFEKMLLIGQYNLMQLQKGEPNRIINVHQWQQAGVRAPELSGVDVEKIKNILAERSRNGRAPTYARNERTGAPAQTNNQGDTENGPPATNNQAGAQQGYYRWVGINNSVSLDVPQGWQRAEGGAVPGMIFTAQDPQTALGVNVFHYPKLSSPSAAMQAARKGVQATGGKVKIATQKDTGRGAMVYTGTTSRGQAVFEWLGYFVPAPQMGVIGLFAGAPKGTLEGNSATINQIMNSFHVAGDNGGGVEQQNPDDEQQQQNPDDND